MLFTIAWLAPQDVVEEARSARRAEIGSSTHFNRDSRGLTCFRIDRDS